MIYLDSAATSLLKPTAVALAMSEAVARCASPGRGSHEAAMRAADVALDCREEAARLFRVPTPEQVVFTMNATHGLNIAIRSLARPGMRVVISGYEHNAVTRPLHAIGAEVDVAASPLFDQAAALRAFERRIHGAGLVICTHVSNVFGFVLPVEDIAALCRAHGVPLIVDASQSAGVLPVDFAGLGCAFLACPGHKGLLGPQGTGLLLCGAEAQPLICGGTGSRSSEQTMPDFLPDRLEAGTHNIPGIAGLREGLRYIHTVGVEQIHREENRLARLFLSELGDVPRVRFFTAENPEAQTGVFSLQPQTIDCEGAAEQLGARGVAVRAGLHCAPLAHESAGTRERGTLRFSFSPFLKAEEMCRTAEIVREILHSA